MDFQHTGSFTQCQLPVVSMGTWPVGDPGSLWVDRIPSHITGYLVGSPLNQGCSLIIFFIDNKHTKRELEKISCSRVNERLWTCSNFVHSFFSFFDILWTRGTELFMNMFKFQEIIWTKLEQMESEQVHEQLNLNKFRTYSWTCSNTICSSSGHGTQWEVFLDFRRSIRSK